MGLFSQIASRVGRRVLGGGKPPVRPVSPFRKVVPPEIMLGENLSDRKPMDDSFHDGGTVKKDGTYKLKKGEKVVPAPKKSGRQSKYRAVYLERRKK